MKKYRLVLILFVCACVPAPAVMGASSVAGQEPVAADVAGGGGPIDRDGALAEVGGGAVPLDMINADDMIVTGSVCIGFDCLTDGTENFGFDTLKLKENNLQIYLDDTSSTAGFPANDWRIIANDSSSPGASYFKIMDATNNTEPFKIMAGAPNYSLVVAASGNLGLGTNTPTSPLEMARTGTDATLALNRTDGATARLAATASTVQVGSVTDAPLEFQVNSATAMVLDGSGNLKIEGALIEASDVNRKENFCAVAPADVLSHIAKLPIFTWNYIEDDPAARHMGPTAQDFYAAFGLGADDKHIAPLDANGVALAGIQELYRQLQAEQAETAQIRAENEELRQRLDSLEATVAALLAAQADK